MFKKAFTFLKSLIGFGSAPAASFVSAAVAPITPTVTPVAKASIPPDKPYSRLRVIRAIDQQTVLCETRRGRTAPALVVKREFGRWLLRRPGHRRVFRRLVTH